MASPPVLDIQPLLVQKEVDASEPCHQAGSLRLEVAPGTSAPALPARLFMIFDMSGSMRGRPMELLEAALSHVFTNLRPQDKLSMIRFGGDASVDFVEWDKATIEATGLNPFSMVGGGTNYDAAIDLSLSTIRGLPGLTDAKTSHGIAKQVLFLTDGHPHPASTANRSLDLAGEHPGEGYTFNTLGLGDESSVDKPRLMTLSEVGRGQYFNANEPTELADKMDKLVSLSQNIAYASPTLTMEVFPCVKVTNVSVPLVGMDVLDEAGPGVHSIDLPDIELGSPLELVYEVHVEQQPIGTKQDILQWSIPGQPPVVSSIVWADQGTVLMAAHNTRPTVLSTIGKTVAAMKEGNEAEAMKLANTLTKIGTTLGDTTATGIATKITEAGGKGVDIGEILEDLTATKTNPDGTLK